MQGRGIKTFMTIDISSVFFNFAGNSLPAEVISLCGWVCALLKRTLHTRSNPKTPMNSPKFSQDPSQTFGGAESRSAVTQAARNTASKIGSAASETASRVKQSAEEFVADRKNSAADRVGAYSSAIHNSARSLEEQDPNIAWLTHRAADRLESVANYVRTRDLRGIREDAENLARRHPAAFFGGMCVAGLVLGSVIRATRQSSRLSGDFLSESSDEANRSESDYPVYGGRGSRETSLEDIPSQGGTAAEI